MFLRCSTFMAVAAGLLALPASAAALPAGGVYTGNATTPFGPQERSPAFIRLGADPTKPADARIYYLARCADGSVLANVFFYDATDRIRDGRIDRSQQLEDLKQPDGTVLREKATTKLTFTDTTVRGTLQIAATKTPPNGQPIACDTGAIQIRLSRRGGYGGALTPQENPVVLTRTRTRARLSLRVGATCRPAGQIERNIVLTAPIDDGRFAREGELTYTQSNGTSITMRYDLSGRLTRTRTTGTLRVRATSRRPDGSAGPTCDSGLQRLTLRR